MIKVGPIQESIIAYLRMCNNRASFWIGMPDSQIIRDGTEHSIWNWEQVDAALDRLKDRGIVSREGSMVTLEKHRNNNV